MPKLTDEQRAIRQRYMDLISNAGPFNDGRSFNYKDVAALINRPPRYCVRLLSNMYHAGLLTRCGNLREGFQYRQQRDVMPFDWRVDRSVHEMVEQLGRDW